MKRALIAGFVALVLVYLVQYVLFPTTYNTFLKGFTTSCVVDVVVATIWFFLKDQDE